MITTDLIYGTRDKFYRHVPGYNFGLSHFSKMEVPQDQFLAELDPNGHKIHDPSYYENIEKKIPIDPKDEKKGFRNIEVEIERISIPIQPVILTKQLTHICGNPIQFISHILKPTPKQEEAFITYKQGWNKKNMNDAIYEFCKSVKATGNAAFCAVKSKNEFSYRVFSALNQDGLHPIRDFNGRLRIFGRSFTQYDYSRKEYVPYMEVWDDKNYTLLSYSTDAKNGTMGWDGKTFLPKLVNEVDGWEIVIPPTPHNFESIPIEYLYNPEGACWSPIQHLIDKLEMALSQLFENNKAYAFRIMFIKGGFRIEGTLKGEARAIISKDLDADAKFLEKADASTSFGLQLDQTLKFILMGSFTVLPPEKISGDIAGVAIKIMYSPAIEKAINDRYFFNSSVDHIVKLFKEGYQVEKGISSSDFNTLDLRGDINIYIPQNDTEVAQINSLGVAGGWKSKQSAAETDPSTAADEMYRLKKQSEEESELEIERERRSISGINPTNTQRQQVAEI